MKLKYKTFSDYATLIEYVNLVGIEKENIQSINQAEYRNIVLIYWE
ncbi:MAG: hypothetical protein KBT03_04650 [Bacteroidales bacterium]|nr:hypothetical protein [Candidatus Scybalousia scybalohippi]